MFKRKGGGGVKGLLNNVKKNCTFLSGWLPLLHLKDGFMEEDYWAIPRIALLFKGLYLQRDNSLRQL